MTASPPRPGPAQATLLLVTAQFPYRGGEPFLEVELPYLAEAFDRVILVPCQVGELDRPLPANVTVEPGLARPRNLAAAGRLGATLRGLLNPWLALELAARPWLARRPPALRRLIIAAYEEARTRRWLAGFLPRLGPGPAVLATYWLRPQALALAWAKAQRPRTRVVSRAHAMDLYEPDNDPPYLPLQGRMVRAMDRLYPVSRHGREYFISRWPEAEAKIEVGYLGSPEPGFLGRPSPDGRIRLVSCSYLFPVKRIHLLIAGLAEAARLDPEARLEWTHLGDGALRPELEALARRSLPERVAWRFAGQIPPDEIMDYYRDYPVDLLLNVSSSEGLPVSIMEALSVGLPVLATAIAGTPELVDGAVGGLLPPDPSPTQIGRAILDLTRSGPATAARREAARRRWAERVRAEANYPEFARRLRALLDEPA